MSFQAYLDSITAKTGKRIEELTALAAARGLTGPQVKAGDVFAWAKADFDLGRGHAMALFSLFKAGDTPPPSDDARVDKAFRGGKAAWRPVFDAVLAQARTWGDDVGTSPTDTYVSLVRGGKKFAILQPAAAHLDIGLKRKGVAATLRFAEAGAWNAMVTHRVRVSQAAEVDGEILDWIRAAYDAAV